MIYETGFPGYDAVKLSQDGILVELTATHHVGFHRYTFPKGQAPHLLQECSESHKLVKFRKRG